MTDEPTTLSAEEFADFDACWVRAMAKRAEEYAKADPQTAARYAEHYRGDLRIFLHQLAEISAILSLPYDAAFDLNEGCFYWRQGVYLFAGPDQERSHLVVNSSQFSTRPDALATIDALVQFCERCSIRFHQPPTVKEPDFTGRIVDVPNLNDTGPNHRAYAAIEQWTAAGLTWEVYNDSSSGDVAFSFSTKADADRAKAILSSLTTANG